jgi:SAM-dependent methyltransferase
MRDQFVYTSDDVLNMLDALLEDRRGWWNEFFADRAKPCPFFTEWPDENLIAWFADGSLSPGCVLELGCGNGRNATYLASLGCSADAVDFSAQAIDWARDLRINGYRLDLTDDEAFDLTISVAAGQLDAAGNEKRLRLVPATG